MGSMINKAAAYYAPKKEESELDAHSLPVKAIIIAVCVFIEIVIYSYLLYYYTQACIVHYGASTCAYAIDKGWDQSIVNTPGLRWIECYDTSGSAFNTTLTDAQEATDDDFSAYEDVKACHANSDGNPDDDFSFDDDEYYNPDACCNGWFNEDDCIPADFCFNTFMMCEWEVCPQPMEVFSSANGAMTGIHFAFFYIVVSVLLCCFSCCLVGKKPDIEPKESSKKPLGTSF